MDQARAPKGRIYRKKSEGNDQYCTAKGRKVGTGGKTAKFIVAMSYKKGVVLCKQYEHMNGLFFQTLLKNILVKRLIGQKRIALSLSRTGIRPKIANWLV